MLVGSSLSDVVATLLPPAPDEEQQTEEVDVDDHDDDVADRLVLQRDRIPAAERLRLQEVERAVDDVGAVPAELLVGVVDPLVRHDAERRNITPNV